MKVYDYSYGNCQTEQDFVTALDTFLVSLGWTRVETVSDTASDRDYTWYSVGEDPDNYDPIYIRTRATSNNIYGFGYSIYVASDDNSGELYDASYTYIPTNGYSFRWWAYGDKNFVCYTILNGNDSQAYTAYQGFIMSYYIPEKDNLPLLIKGQIASSYAWRDTNTSYMHDPTTSGELAYKGYDWSTALSYDIGMRTNEVAILPVIIYNTDGANQEVRGEAYGVYQVNGDRVANFSPLVSASGIFICFKSNNDTQESYIYGPVASDISGFSMW